MSDESIPENADTTPTEIVESSATPERTGRSHTRTILEIAGAARADPSMLRQ